MFAREHRDDNSLINLGLDRVIHLMLAAASALMYFLYANAC